MLGGDRPGGALPRTDQAVRGGAARHAGASLPRRRRRRRQGRGRAGDRPRRARGARRRRGCEARCARRCDDAVKDAARRGGRRAGAAAARGLPGGAATLRDGRRGFGGDAMIGIDAASGRGGPTHARRRWPRRTIAGGAGCRCAGRGYARPLAPALARPRGEIDLILRRRRRRRGLRRGQGGPRASTARRGAARAAPDRAASCRCGGDVSRAEPRGAAHRHAASTWPWSTAPAGSRSSRTPLGAELPLRRGLRASAHGAMRIGESQRGGPRHAA